MFVIGLLLLGIGAACTGFLLSPTKYGLQDDPNPNPIGVGILLCLTVPAGGILTLIGLVKAIERDRHKRGRLSAS